MKTFLSAFKNVNLSSDLNAFLVSMSISIPFTVIAYFIYKKRMDYLGFKVDRIEKFVFVLMPLFWFLWIAVYIYGVYLGGSIFRKKKPKTQQEIHDAIMDNALMQIPGDKRLSEKLHNGGTTMKIVMGILVYGVFIIGGGLTYIFNIVEMLKNSDVMSTWSMVWGVLGVFIPPLGCIRGLLYILS